MTARLYWWSVLPNALHKSQTDGGGGIFSWCCPSLPPPPVPPAPGDRERRASAILLRLEVSIASMLPPWMVVSPVWSPTFGGSSLIFHSSSLFSSSSLPLAISWSFTASRCRSRSNSCDESFAAKEIIRTNNKMKKTK